MAYDALRETTPDRASRSTSDPRAGGTGETSALVDDALRSCSTNDRRSAQAVVDWIGRRERKAATEVRVETTELTSFDLLVQSQGGVGMASRRK